MKVLSQEVSVGDDLILNPEFQSSPAGKRAPKIPAPGPVYRDHTGRLTFDQAVDRVSQVVVGASSVTIHTAQGFRFSYPRDLHLSIQG